MTTRTTSRRVRSPEDIRVGDFIAVLAKRYQFLPDHMETGLVGSSVEPIEMTLIPCDAGQPMKVVSLSLPFVMTEGPDGTRNALDTRQHALAIVDEDYAMAAKTPKRKKQSSGKKRKGKGKGKKKRK